MTALYFNNCTVRLYYTIALKLKTLWHHWDPVLLNTGIQRYPCFPKGVVSAMPSSLPSDRHMGFSSAETIGRIFSFLIWKFWKLCGVAVLFLILVYWMYGTVVILILLIAVVIGGLYHYQDSLLYFPEQPESSRVFVQTPSSLQLPFELVTLTTKDKTDIVAYFIKQPPAIMPTAPTLLYFHGNAGNIGHRLHNAQALYHHCGFNVLLVEYRGYGKSHGSPSESGECPEEVRSC